MTLGKLAALPAREFSLEMTLTCGQVFHWVRAEAGWLGLIGDRAVYVEQKGETLSCTPGAEECVANYFALDHPLEEIYATFPSDPAMQQALHFCRGMRIIRQPAWECLATFITSSMKQVAHIMQMSHAIRRRFGERVEYAGDALFTYPTPARLAVVSEEALRACSIGYRAKNLLGSARMIAAGEVDLAHVATLDDEAARAELCRLPGVGEKVANCALLFGFERKRAFPIDVWIERVLREIYFARKRRPTTRRLREFSQTYFGENSGYAQQYLFHHARLTWPKARQRARKRQSSRPPC